MQDSIDQLKNHFIDLADRSFNRGRWEFSHFLTPAEQDSFLSLRLNPAFLFGGYDAAERKIACFGSENLCGYEQMPPVVCVCIEPVNMKFADKLTHRDFLGSVMALGVKREMLGDIVVADSVGWLFCLDSIAEYIVQQLFQVRRTTVRCGLSEPPEFVSTHPEASEVVVASDRLDALVAGVYDLSRSEAKSLVEGERVYVDSRLAASAGGDVKEGAIVSVRGYGRFVFYGQVRETRRGRMRVSVGKY